MTEPAVRFERVFKRFTIHHERARSFQDLLVRGFRRGTAREEFWALEDVSFSLAPGAALGIVGTNGSGKSTLLKLATRILSPTGGNIQVRGRVSALLELGAGFHPELTGRDNVFLNASILGLQRREVAARFDAIVSFAGLERFIDIPVKHYSSGMCARLGFAVAVHVDPDVLLIDEVLSVGDETFQERCYEAIHRFHREGKTLVLVSHDLDAIRNICTEAIWLDGGRVRAHAEPGEVVADYHASAHAEAAESGGTRPVGVAGPGHRWGSREAEIVGVEFLDSHQRVIERVVSAEGMAIRIRYRAAQRVERPVFGIAIMTANDTLVTGPNTKLSGLVVPFIEGQGSVTYAVEELPLLPGDYWVSTAIYDDPCTHPYDHHDRMYALKVAPGGHAERHGIIRMPARWIHEPSSGEPQHPGEAESVFTLTSAGRARPDPETA